MSKYSKLTEAVIRHMGLSRKESIQTCIEAAEHGADSGYGRFVYYDDTCRFFKKNKGLIFTKLAEDFYELGYESIDEMLSDFKCLKDLDYPKSAMTLYCSSTTKDPDKRDFENGLAWYALEEAGREIESSMEK